MSRVDHVPPDVRPSGNHCVYNNLIQLVLVLAFGAAGALLALQRWERLDAAMGGAACGAFLALCASDSAVRLVRSVMRRQA